VENRIRQVFDAIKDCVGDKGWHEGDAALPYLRDWYDTINGEVGLVVTPTTTEQVAQVMRLCHVAGIIVTPQGGRTGLVQASTPFEGNVNLVLNLARMNQIRNLDLIGDTVTVDAGIILENLREKVAVSGKLFPLSIGAKGSCQIGGNIATNAGGINVLRYGNTRDLVLGLEAVLPDGTIWSDMSGLRKDNTGFDIKQLLIGSEGTLAVITGAVLKLFPHPTASETAFAGVQEPTDALALLTLAKERLGPDLCAFELVSHGALLAAERAIGTAAVALKNAAPWYIICEIAGTKEGEGYQQDMESFIEAAFEKKLVSDGFLAQNQAQQDAIWRTREAISEGLHHACRHDISVKVSHMAQVLKILDAAVTEIDPDAEIAPFGHMGDGNLHYAVAIGGDHSSVGAPDVAAKIKARVYEIVHQNGGSFSAEHGVGRNVQDFTRYKDQVSRGVMSQIKQIFDPRNQMNPGVLFADPRQSGR